MTASETQLRELIAAMAGTINSHLDELTALDSAVGDGDHGLGMKRGFDAVAADADAIVAKGFPGALGAIGMKLVSTIGGASGPLYGTLFITLDKELAASPGDLAGAARRAVDAVAARGKSQRGQKTMLDVLYPVADAIAEGKSAAEVVAIAEAEAVATGDRLAIRGRASFLGDRSRGNIDPGARSAALLIAAAAGVFFPKGAE